MSRVVSYKTPIKVLSLYCFENLWDVEEFHRTVSPENEGIGGIRPVFSKPFTVNDVC